MKQFVKRTNHNALLLSKYSTNSRTIHQVDLRRHQRQHQHVSCMSRTLLIAVPFTTMILNCWIILTYLLITEIHAGWIDIDTPLDKRTTVSMIDGTTYQLVRFTFVL
jgi:hypothetical protein